MYDFLGQRSTYKLTGNAMRYAGSGDLSISETWFTTDGTLLGHFGECVNIGAQPGARTDNPKIFSPNISGCEQFPV